MPVQRKSRFGASFIIVGGLLAAAGEIVNAQNMDILGSSWYLSLELIIFGAFILLMGLLPFALVSGQINALGNVGCFLLLPGGFLLIIGTATLDWVILPFLSRMGYVMAAAVNEPSSVTQTALNKIISVLNSVGGGSIFRKIFKKSLVNIPAVHIPKVSGVTLEDKIFADLHLPSIEQLTWWGRFSLSGAGLTIGCIILGVGLLSRTRTFISPGTLLIVFALLNLLCQYLLVIPPVFGDITAAGLFLALVWLGVLEWMPTTRYNQTEDVMKDAVR